MVAEIAARVAQSVLIVDDEPEMRSLLADILSDKGYRIDTAVDGVAALKIVVASHPDLVLLDVDMPQLRGGEALVAIRAISPNTKVIMISGKADAGEARRALAAGAFDYVTKPFDLNYLDEAVRIAMLS
jgi:two-component system, OmpR family, KDP operon response regulator KdpE